MLSKEECLKAHEELCRMLVATDYLDGRAICTYPIMENELGTFYELIKEHFELVEKYEMLDNTYSMICEDYLNPQPYKFEDLQTEMQVYDNYLKECIEISVMCGRNIANHTVTFFRWGQEELETFDMTFNNADFDEVKNKEQWKEWSLHNEKI